MKVVCESCGSSFPFNIAKDFTECPVCHASFDVGAEDEERVSDKEPSFGNDVELGENDSFDDDKIDCWWYDIDEPSADGTIRGRVYTNCARCGNFMGSVPYQIAKTGDYLLIDSRIQDRCGICGNELKNHILSKRPSDWVDPRKRDMWIKDYKNIPKCPICSSTKIHKISITNKAASALTFGIFAAGHVSKTYKCDICGAKF